MLTGEFKSTLETDLCKGSSVHRSRRYGGQMRSRMGDGVGEGIHVFVNETQKTYSRPGPASLKSV